MTVSGERWRSVVRLCLGIVCVALIGVVPARGHHSFAVYDFDQQIPFAGTVETLNFKNPHISMTLSHVREDGGVEIVNFIEGAPANMLIRNGLTPDMIAPGARITAIGSPRRDDPTLFFLRRVILEDGREFQ